MGQTHEHELQVALAAAKEGAAILGSRHTGGGYREKARADLVTEIDELSERTIEEYIRRAFPEDAFIAEEFSSAGAVGGRRWIVDPLDGTANYVHGHPFACVSIALVDDDGPVVGVVHAPFLSEIYSARRGGGAWLNGTALSVSGVDDAANALLATGFPFKAGKGNPPIYFDLVEELVLTTHGVRRAGSAALDLAFVAAGRLDGYFELGLSSWDVAAGILLVTEAGGSVTGWPGDSESPLRTGRLLASNGRIHQWLQDATGKYVSRI